MIRCIQWTTESVWCCYKSNKMHNWHHQCFNLIDKNCNILKIQLSSYVWLYSWRIFFISDSVIIFIEYSIYVFALDKSNNFCSPKWKTIDNEHSISDNLSQKSDSSFLTISDMMAVGPRVTSFDVERASIIRAWSTWSFRHLEELEKEQHQEAHKRA